MAHASEKRTQLRGLFVYQRLPMETACKKMGIPKSTANRWKQEAKDHGDCWDTARAAVSLGDESLRQQSVSLLNDYVLQHTATMKMLREDKKMTAQQHAETLASMADSFNKTMAAFKRMSPQLNREAVALDVLERLVKFTQAEFPQHILVLPELLEPFAIEIHKAYG